MAVEIKVPTLGESVTSARVARWMKKVGETVAADEPLVELETDKVTVEVNAPSAGSIESIAAAEGADDEPDEHAEAERQEHQTTSPAAPSLRTTGSPVRAHAAIPPVRLLTSTPAAASVSAALPERLPLRQTATTGRSRGTAAGSSAPSGKPPSSS